MSYFSRLTDIVTCNLTALLEEADDPAAALREIIAEMREGLAGAQRSVATATASAAKLTGEMAGLERDAGQWEQKAREELRAGREAEARRCLVRKQETVDLIAGLAQQHRAAQATKDHLATMQRALEARLAEALRRAESLSEPSALSTDETAVDFTPRTKPPTDTIDAELEQLKRQMGIG